MTRECAHVQSGPLRVRDTLTRVMTKISPLATLVLAACTVGVPDDPFGRPGPSLGGATDGPDEVTTFDDNPIDPTWVESTGMMEELDDSSGEPENVCGDGVVGGVEECDDGEVTADCDGDCTAASCGDGEWNLAAGEQCDAGGATVTCDVDCSLVACGDGLANAAAGEECDDGGDTQACDADCTLRVCGDGYVNGAAGEECDGTDTGCHPSNCAWCPTQSVVETFGSPPPWGLEEGWEVGPAVASSDHTPSCGNGDPGTDADGVPGGGVAGVVIGGVTPMNGGPAYLTTSSVGVLDSTYVELRFDAWQNLVDPSHRHFVEVLQDGVGWQQVWTSGPGDQPQDSTWVHHVYDITALVGNTVIVRFGYETVGTSESCSGWNLDNVEVFAYVNCG
mgnify:CR=1 FL=1